MKRKRLLMDIVLVLLVIVSGVMLFKGKKDPKLEDYNYFWETVEEGYPFYTFLNEDNRLEKVKEKYKKEVKKLDYKDSEEVVDFYNKVIGEITEDGTIGHFRGMNKGTYMMYLNSVEMNKEFFKLDKKKQLKILGDILKEEEKEDPEKVYKEMIKSQKENYKVVDSKKVKKFYDITEKDYEFINENIKLRFNIKDEEEIVKKTYNIRMENGAKNFIYIKLPDMDPSDKNEEFYQSIADYIIENNNRENLIIDIRDNVGGSSEYWMNIMKYLVRGEEKHISKTLFKESKVLEKYYNIPDKEKYLIKNLDDSDEIKKKYGKDFDYFVERVGTGLSPKENEPIFNGKIWVLVDENVNSAATEFMNLCNSIDYITTVGTNGGGGMNSGYALLQLPNAGMIYRFDLSVALNDNLLPTDIYGVSPDIYTEEDALEYVKKLIEN